MGSQKPRKEVSQVLEGDFVGFPTVFTPSHPSPGSTQPCSQSRPSDRAGTTLSGGCENKVIGDGPHRESCCHPLLPTPLPGHCGCPLWQHSCTEGFGSCSAHAIPGPTCQTQPGLCLSPHSPPTSFVPASLATKKEEISCVTLDKSFNLSGPPVSHL